MNGQIIYAARGGGMVTAACRVNEGPPTGWVEYVATVPAVDAAGNALPTAQIKAALVAAWSAQRAATQTQSVDVSALINGPVTL